MNNLEKIVCTLSYIFYPQVSVVLDEDDALVFTMRFNQERVVREGVFSPDGPDALDEIEKIMVVVEWVVYGTSSLAGKWRSLIDEDEKTLQIFLLFKVFEELKRPFNMMVANTVLASTDSTDPGELKAKVLEL